MKINQLFTQGSPVFSFEFFLPKTPQAKEGLESTLRDLQKLAPHFVTLTYGAGGSARESTINLAKALQNEYGFLTAMHLTCITHTRKEIEVIAAEIKKIGIENIMALRGDPPKDVSLQPLENRDYRYASDLVRHLRQLGDWCLGVAGYPEKHPEAPTPETDLFHLKEKIDAGGDFITTQLFFDNEAYFKFVDRVRAIGIKVPIVPGIMPITNFSQTKKFSTMCGAMIPIELEHRLESVQADSEAVMRVGVEYAKNQCLELLKKGAPGIHFYTLNRSSATIEILRHLRQTMALSPVAKQR